MKIPKSNLGREIIYRDWGITWFSYVTPWKFRALPFPHIRVRINKFSIILRHIIYGADKVSLKQIKNNETENRTNG